MKQGALRPPSRSDWPLFLSRRRPAPVQILYQVSPADPTALIVPESAQRRRVARLLLPRAARDEGEPMTALRTE